MNINFNDGPFFEILETADPEKVYQVEFINKDNNRTETTQVIRSNMWARADIRYFVNWKIRVTGIDNPYFYEHDFDCTGKRVLICIESKALGDMMAWTDYAEQFRVAHNCHVICTTYLNDLFRDQYPEIEFVEPGVGIFDLYALYRVGIFWTGDTFDHKTISTDPFKLPLQKLASEILGLQFKESRPRLPLDPNIKKKKQVSIAIHGSAQCKYWNNPTGWQEVVDYLNEEGYQVVVVSKEENTPVWLAPLKGVIKHPPGELIDVIRVMQESEFFIGLTSGLSWLAWAVGLPTVLVSGFTDTYVEPLDNVYRVIDKNVCHGCWERHYFNPGDWYFCPEHKGTNRAFECTKSIKATEVIRTIQFMKTRKLAEQPALSE